MALKRMRFVEDILDDDDFIGFFDSEDEKAKHGGSKPGKQPNIQRDFKLGHTSIIRDYFSDNPIYPVQNFRRRFRMPKRLFTRIYEAVVEKTPFLKQRFDATKNLDQVLCRKLRLQSECSHTASPAMRLTNTAESPNLWHTIA